MFPLENLHISLYLTTHLEQLQVFLAILTVKELIYHNSVVIHSEPDILEYEVKRALGRITTKKKKKLLVVTEIKEELLKIMKDDDVKVLQPISPQIWKTVVVPGLENVFLFQPLRRIMPKNVPTMV